MAAITAWIMANLPVVVGGVIALVIGWVNRDKIAEKISSKKAEDGMQGFDGIDLSALKDLLKSLGTDIEEKKSAVCRSVSLISLVRLETAIEDLPVSDEKKAEGRECIKTLGALFLVSHDDTVPVVRTTTKKG